MSTWVVMPSDDDVIHKNNKYIDKIWKNGKWRYIYDDVKSKVKNAIGKDQKHKLVIANQNVEFAEKYKENAYKRMHNLIKNDLDTKRSNLPKEQKEVVLQTNDSRIKRNKEDINSAERGVKEYKTKQKAAQEAYNKTLLGKIDQVKDAGLKAWDNFTSLFKKSKSSSPVTNKTYSKVQYTPSYSTKKSPTTSTRGTAYTPSYKTKPTTSSRGTAYTPSYGSYKQPSGNARSANSFLKNSNKKISGGLASSVFKQNSGIVGAGVGSEAANMEKKRKKKRG